MPPEGASVRLSMVSIALFSVLAAAVFILALFPPTITTAPASTVILPAKRALILDDILSGYATINEGADHILAVSKRTLEWGTNGPMVRIYPSLARIQVTGNIEIPDPEQVLRLRPDIVFASTWQAGFLRMLRLPGLLEVKYNSQKPTQFRVDTWKAMGETTGKSARAAALQDRYAMRMAALGKQIPSDATKHKRVAYVGSYKGAWWNANSSYYLAYKLELAGAINAAKGFKFNSAADLEQLLLLDPDVILFISNPGDKTTMKEILGQTEFQSVRAVKEHRIYKLPEHTYMNEPVEDPLLLTWMAEVFYPDVMPRRLRDQYKETYREVYHYAISDDEIDKAIYLDENRHSAGYDRFAR